MSSNFENDIFNNQEFQKEQIEKNAEKLKNSAQEEFRKKMAEIDNSLHQLLFQKKMLFTTRPTGGNQVGG